VSNSSKSDNRATDQSGANAVKAKVERLLTDRTKLKEQWRANAAALRDAVAAGRLFGVEIDLPVDLDQPRLTQTSLFEPAADTSIREAVLDQLKNAGEAGAKAADIRREIEKNLGRKLHEKTIGMTLYRLSLKGQSKRDGITWFYVPTGT